MSEPHYRLHVREPSGRVLISSALFGVPAARELAQAMRADGCEVVRCEGVGYEDLPVEALPKRQKSPPPAEAEDGRDEDGRNERRGGRGRSVRLRS